MEEKWNKDLPEVPESVHNRIMFTLEQLNEREEVSVKKNSFKKMVVAASLVVIALGTTAFAARYFKWHEKTIEQFGAPSTQVQEDMSDKGIVKEQLQTVTDQGVTISAIQTVRDEYSLYVLLEVTAGENMIGEVEAMDYQLITEATEPFSNISSAFLDEMEVEGTRKKRYYWISALENLTRDWSGNSITIDITRCISMTYENGHEGTPHYIDGNWTLDIPLDNGDAQTISYEINREVMLSDEPITINRIAIAPTSVIIYYDMESAIEWENKVFAKEIESGEAKETGIFPEQRFLNGFVDSDGKVLHKGFAGVTSSPRTPDGKGEEAILMSFDYMINPEDICAILLGSEQVRVDLEQK